MPSPNLVSLKLEDFGELQSRYQSLKPAPRAAAVLTDAGPALDAADRILTKLAAEPQAKQAFDNIRKNALITGKMRASEAKTMLMDGEDFIEGTRRKLAAWRKTMERLSQGEGIVSDKNRDYIPSNAPLALALIGIASIGNYLSIVQLAIGELGKIEDKKVGACTSMAAEMRRCATVLSDYEHASSLTSLVN